MNRDTESQGKLSEWEARAMPLQAALLLASVPVNVQGLPDWISSSGV